MSLGYNDYYSSADHAADLEQLRRDHEQIFRQILELLPFKYSQKLEGEMKELEILRSYRDYIERELKAAQPDAEDNRPFLMKSPMNFEYYKNVLAVKEMKNE